MINFKNDYNDVAHEAIIDLLVKYKDNNYIGYSEDTLSALAIKKIKTYFDHQVHVHFMVGGTITNKTVIAHLLKPYEAVISASTGHIDVHETGAIEQTGHKIITIFSEDGKISAQQIKNTLKEYNDFHRVIPKMIYISNATETGLIYQKDELKAIYEVAQENNLYLFIDGARLGVALTAETSDLTLNDISLYSDVFYIGGTKNGAMLGEAILTKHEDIFKNLKYSIKQNGGLLAKGFLIGLQFDALFTNDLFFNIARAANDRALELGTGLKTLLPSFKLTPTNQQFLSLSNDVINALKVKYQFEIWEEKDSESVIRLVTTYRRTSEEIKEFLTDLKAILKK